MFGYYIEISKTYQGQVPENYIRKQTLANCERYITQELKELESYDSGAQRTALRPWNIEMFLPDCASYIAEQLRPGSAARRRRWRTLDVLLLSGGGGRPDSGYCRPEIDLTGEIHITEGRHPVVEQMLKDSLFVPNDTELGTPAQSGGQSLPAPIWRVNPPICGRWR